MGKFPKIFLFQWWVHYQVLLLAKLTSSYPLQTDGWKMKFLLTWSLFWWHANFHKCRWWCPMIRQETCERLQTPNSTEGNIHHERWRCRDWKTPGKQGDTMVVEKNQKSFKCWFDFRVLLPQPGRFIARVDRQRVRIDSFGSKELLFDHYGHISTSALSDMTSRHIEQMMAPSWSDLFKVIDGCPSQEVD